MLTLFRKGGSKAREVSQWLKLQIQGKEAETLVPPYLLSNLAQIINLSKKTFFFGNINYFLGLLWGLPKQSIDNIQLGLAYGKLSLLRVITWKEMEQNKELKILCKDLIFAYS